MKIKRIIGIILTGIMAFNFISCNNAAENSNNDNSSAIETQNSSITFTDDLGNEITVKSPKHVAVASESLANAYMLAGGTISLTTEDAIKSDKLNLPEGIENMGSLKTPSIEKILNSDIDLVILSGTISTQVKLKDQLNDAKIPTAYFNIEYFEDYERMMKIFTDITGRKDLYEKNVEQVKSQIDNQKKKATDEKPSVLLLRAYSKGVTAKGSDSMTGAMLKDLGCINVADDKNAFGELSMEAIINADPDYIFVTTMGESDEAAMASLHNMFTSNPAWNNLKAVKEKHYHILDKELFHNKPNEKWGKSYEILADILYPQK
ncbi:MAG: ABC transporter substrate-binding protein [Clostridium sp.]|nr:ABC transporter substrate-binding protein [Clostridium sp.]